MNLKGYLWIFFTMLGTGVDAQKFPAFKPLRYDENYLFLHNDSSHNWYKKMKYTTLGKKKDHYISLGGELRFQYLFFNHPGWGDEPADKDGYVLNRYLAHTDIHLGKTFRTFVQLQSSLVNGKEDSSPVDENPLDLHQAFADVQVADLKGFSFLLRVGRQELSYGSQRLVSVREIPNNRQSFDAIKAVVKSKDQQVDLFYSHYVAAHKGIFDDGFNRGTKFWGMYVVRHDLPWIKHADLYYLGLWKRQATFDMGTERELRHTGGLRIWDNEHSFRYDYEAAWQWGKFGTNDIRAWTISFNTSYQFKHAALKPELGLKAEMITGDRNREDQYLQSFNPLFPRGAYFGLAALIGPSNLKDLHPSLSLYLRKNLVLNMDADFFWRYTTHDGVYAPNVSLIYTGKNNPYTYIGSQYATDIQYTPNPFLYLRAEFTWFNSGDFLKAAGKGKDVLFAGITTLLKF